MHSTQNKPLGYQRPDEDFFSNFQHPRPKLKIRKNIPQENRYLNDPKTKYNNKENSNMGWSQVTFVLYTKYTVAFEIESQNKN